MLTEISHKGLVLLGCGKMGSAMLTGWLANGLAAQSVWVQDPNPSDWLGGVPGLNLNTALPQRPAIVLVAVKPQMMNEALPALRNMGNGETLFVSVAAGIPMARYSDILGSETPIIRAMPNLPAAIGQGITALVGNSKSDEKQMGMAETLLQGVGQTVRLDREDQMDAVTAVSGSGPAYVFHMVETLAAAGIAEGLSPDIAMHLAKATVAGAGAMAKTATEDPGQLRQNVTSPGGTTAAGLGVLMDADSGLAPLLRATVAAAAQRSRELAE